MHSVLLLVAAQADNPDSKPNVVNIWPHGEVLMAYNDHTKLNVACRSCRTKLSVSRLVNATGAWDHVAQFGPSPSDYLKVSVETALRHTAYPLSFAAFCLDESNTVVYIKSLHWLLWGFVCIYFLVKIIAL
jgi:hypothetical protein